MDAPAPDALLSLWCRRHEGGLLRLLGRLLGSRADAEDALQETYLACLKARGEFDPARDPGPFVRRIAVRKAIDQLRGRSRATLPLAEEPSAAVPAPRAEFDLGVLPPEQRAALVLFYWQGLSVAEIAAALDAPPGTIKTWMHRARARLKSAREEDGGGRT